MHEMGMPGLKDPMPMGQWQARTFAELNITTRRRLWTVMSYDRPTRSALATR